MLSFRGMKPNQAAWVWLSAGGIGFLSGLILFFAHFKGKGVFLNLVHTSPAYLLTMTSLFIIFASLLFLIPDKGPITKE
jgi:hypothetical protein